jgi:putrescine transport system substrate-binding protein
MRAWVVAVLALVAGAGLAEAQTPTLNIYNWSDYLAPETLAIFTRETGIAVNYDTYDSDETLEAKLFAGHSGYDLVVPTMVPFLARQIKGGFYQPLDKTKLHNLGNLDPVTMAAMAKSDPGNAYAIPWAIGSVGISYNVDAIAKRMPKAPVDSLALMFDPAVLAKFKDCGVAFLDSPVDVLPAALLYLGLDPASQNQADLKRATDLMMSLRPFIRKFDSSGYLNDLANGDLCLVWSYSSDGLIAQRRAAQANKNVHIRYVIPKEGAQLYIDAMAIPKDAPHPELAHMFMDFLMRPEIAAAQVNSLYIQAGNKAAENLITPAILSDPAIFPPPEIRNLLYVGTVAKPDFDRLRTRAWTRIKTNR